MSCVRLVLAVVLTGLLLPATTVSSSAAASEGAAHTRSYMAGLRLTDPDHVSAVIIKAVRVPEVTCASTGFQGIALGAGSEPTAGSLEYFAGVIITCRGGVASYAMRTSVGDLETTDPRVAPGDRIQVGVTLNCPSYPSCEVFSFATNLYQDDATTDVEGETTITSDSAEFAGFPVYKRPGARPASVPTFSSVEFFGCLFGDRLINKRDERLVRKLPGGASLRPGNFRQGIFELEYHAAR
jgi:hypothetical protein